MYSKRLQAVLRKRLASNQARFHSRIYLAPEHDWAGALNYVSDVTVFFERCIVSKFVFASLLPTNSLDHPVKTSSVLTMSGPSKRSFDEENGWKNNQRKRKKTTSKRERKKAGALSGAARKDNADISVDIPNGFVTGDRVFNMDSETRSENLSTATSKMGPTGSGAT